MPARKRKRLIFQQSRAVQWPANYLVKVDEAAFLPLEYNRNLTQNIEASPSRYPCAVSSQCGDYLASFNENELQLSQRGETVDRWSPISTCTVRKLVTVRFLDTALHISPRRGPCWRGPKNVGRDVTLVGLTSDAELVVILLGATRKFERPRLFCLPRPDRSPTNIFEASLHLNLDGSLSIVAIALASLVYYEIELNFRFGRNGCGRIGIQHSLRVASTLSHSGDVHSAFLFADREMIIVKHHGEVTKLRLMKVPPRIELDTTDFFPDTVELCGDWQWITTSTIPARESSEVFDTAVRGSLLAVSRHDSFCDLVDIRRMTLRRRIHLGTNVAFPWIDFSPTGTFLVTCERSKEYNLKPVFRPVPDYTDKEFFETILEPMLNGVYPAEAAAAVVRRCTTCAEFDVKRFIKKGFRRITSAVVGAGEDGSNCAGYRQSHILSTLAVDCDSVLLAWIRLHVDIMRLFSGHAVEFWTMCSIIQFLTLGERLEGSLLDQEAYRESILPSSMELAGCYELGRKLALSGDAFLDDDGASSISPLVSWVLDFTAMIMRYGFSYFLPPTPEDEAGPPTHLVVVAHPVFRAAFLRTLHMCRLFRLYLVQEGDVEMEQNIFRGMDATVLDNVIRFLREIDEMQQGWGMSVEDELTMLVDCTLPHGARLPRDPVKYSRAFCVNAPGALYAAPDPGEDEPQWSDVLPSVGGKESIVVDVVTKQPRVRSGIQKWCLVCRRGTGVKSTDHKWAHWYDFACHCGGLWVGQEPCSESLETCQSH